MKKVLNNKSIIIIISLYILELGYATSQTLIGPAVPLLSAKYSITLSDNGMLTTLQGVGGLVALLIGVVLFSRVKRSFMVKLAFGLYCVVLITLSFANTYAMLLVLFLLLGAVTKATDANLNASVTELSGERRNFFLNILHAVYGTGALLGPIITNTLIKSTGEVSRVFLAIGFICVAFLALNVIIQKVDYPIVVKSESAPLLDTLKLIVNKRILLPSLLGMLNAGLAFSLSTYLPSYMLTLGTSEFVASASVSVFWCGIIIGRLVYAKISSKFDEAKTIFISNVIGGTLLFASVLTGNPIITIVGFFIGGFSMSEVIPLSISLAYTRLNMKNGPSATVVMLYTAVGTIIFPYLIGLVADYISFYYAICLLGLFPLVVAFLAFLMVRKKNKTNI